MAVLINGAGHEAAAAFAEATPLHDDCFLLPLPTLSPSLPRLLAADAAATAAATSAVAPAAAVPPAAVDVGAGVSGAMARLALWQGTPLTPSPTEPCAGAAREGAASLSLLPEDLASLVMARLLDEDVRAACVLAAASRALRRLQRAAWLDAPCLHLAGAAGAELAAGVLSPARLLRALRSPPVEISLAGVGGLRAAALASLLEACSACSAPSAGHGPATGGSAAGGTAGSAAGGAGGSALLSLDLSRCAALEAEACDLVALHAPRLRHLGLAGVAAVDDAAVGRLARACAHLGSIDLSACPKVGDGALRALAARGGASQLHTLRLFLCTGVSGAGVAAVCRGCPRLTALDLTGSGGATDEALLSLRNLRALGAGGSERVSDEGVLALASSCPDLETLVLTNTARVSAASVDPLLQRCPRLRLALFAGASRLPGGRDVWRGLPLREC